MLHPFDIPAHYLCLLPFNIRPVADQVGAEVPTGLELYQKRTKSPRERAREVPVTHAPSTQSSSAAQSLAALQPLAELVGLLVEVIGSVVGPVGGLVLEVAPCSLD